MDLQRLAQEIADAAAHIDATTHRLLTRIRQFDEEDGWFDQGALSCAHWLSWRIGLDLGAAREKVRVARALSRLPQIDRALEQGEVSYAKVRAMTRVATPANESQLLDMARHATGAQMEKICRRYRRAVADMTPRDAESEDRRRFVWRRDMETGMVRIEAQLRPEEAALVMSAIEAAQRNCATDVSAEARGEPPVCTRADALVAVARQFLSGGKATAPTWHAIVHLRPRDDDTAELDDGSQLSVETGRRLTCDCSKIEVLEDASGTPLDVGRKTRSIPSALRRALALRDRGCRFPGCTNRLFVDGHHIRHWADGGPTCLGNLVSLCGRHHRFVHECGYSVTLADDGSVVFHDARGRHVPAAPSQRAVASIAIDVTAPVPHWDGEHADYESCVDALHQQDGNLN